MRIIKIHAIRGANRYSHKPVLVMKLALGELAGKDEQALSGLIGQLQHALPGITRKRVNSAYWRMHTFSFSPDYAAQLVANVALELTDQAGIPANDAIALASETAGEALVVIEYALAETTTLLLRTTVELIDALIS